MSRPRVSVDQLHKLLCFMEEHLELAGCKDKYVEGDNQKCSTGSRHSAGKLWRLLAEQLNAVEGGVKRSPDKWCRYWADLKYKTKKRSQTLHAGETLTEVEERVIKLVGTGTKSCNNRSSSNISEDEERKPSFNEDSLDSTFNPIEQVNLSQGYDPKPSTEEILAEAAMRSALAAEKQAEAVVQGVELFREFMTIFRQDISTLQNIARTLLERDRSVS